MALKLRLGVALTVAAFCRLSQYRFSWIQRTAQCQQSLLHRRDMALPEMCLLQAPEAQPDPAAASDEETVTQPLQQMIARHLLDPNTAIPTDNAKLRAAVSPCRAYSMTTFISGS